MDQEIQMHEMDSDESMRATIPQPLSAVTTIRKTSINGLSEKESGGL